MNHTETWAPVVGWDSYSVSTLGNVRGPKGPIKTFLVKGYPSFNASRGREERKSLRVHVEVLRAHVGPSHGMECRHVNDIKTDCRIENLVWGTRRENEADKIRNGGSIIGSRHHQAKLTEDQAIDVLKSSESAASIARRVGLSTKAVCNIRNRKTWSHIHAA